MAGVSELEINDDHPLALELSSLRAAVSRFQHEAHSSALKLQRHSLDSTFALERCQSLERENHALREELAALHTHPDISPHPASLQVPELTLALRRLSDKLTLTEETLLGRTTELANALSELGKAKHEVEGAYELAARTRAREEDGKVQRRDLERRLRSAEEERKMTDNVVREYADLVRTLEGRKSATSSNTSSSSSMINGTESSKGLVDGLKDGRTGLQKLLEEFNEETEKFEKEIERLHSELEISEAKHDAESKAGERDRIELAHARAELAKLQADDNAAAKMVSRYMRFSQSTTDTLQQSIENLKARHTASTATLNLELSNLQSTLRSERKHSERLRTALDELTEQLAREAYGRRREIALRLAVVGREDALAEALKRWIRRARETTARSSLEPLQWEGDEEGPIVFGETDVQQMRQGFDAVIEDAGDLLALVNGSNRQEGVDSGLGSLARILAAQDAVKTLVEELQMETEKRMKLERNLARTEFDERGNAVNTLGNGVLKVQRDSNGHEAPPPSAIDSPVVQQNGSTSTHHNTEPPSPALPLTAALDSPSVVLLQPSPRLADDYSRPPSLPRSPTAASSLPDFAKVSFPSTSSSHTTANNSPVKLSITETLPPVDSHPETTSPYEEHNDTQGPTSEPQAPSSPPSPLPAPPTPPPPPPAHPLLNDLTKVKNRYDQIQRSFRDCHLALLDLKNTLSTLPAQSSPTIASAQAQAQQASLLQTAVSRLDDYNEDARVELEIRIADEERITRGYVTLLSIPGAITNEKEREEVEKAVKVFVGALSGDGGDTEEVEEEDAVKRAKKIFERKLGDLEHDIACVKRAVHGLVESSDASPSPDSESVGGGQGQSWGQLAAGFFAPSRSSSPAPAPPTFGSVMTSPRLRRAPSSGLMHSQAQAQAHAHTFPTSHVHNRTPSDETQANPFAALDLRIPMPAWNPSIPSPGSPRNGGFGSVAGGSGGPGVRQRTTSGMYMLGLGMRNSSIAGTGPGSSSSSLGHGHPMTKGRSGSLVSGVRPGGAGGRPNVGRSVSGVNVGKKTPEVEEREGAESGSEGGSSSDVE